MSELARLQQELQANQRALAQRGHSWLNSRDEAILNEIIDLESRIQDELERMEQPR